MWDGSPFFLIVWIRSMCIHYFLCNLNWDLLIQTTTVSYSGLSQAKCIVSLRNLMKWVWLEDYVLHKASTKCVQTFFSHFCVKVYICTETNFNGIFFWKTWGLLLSYAAAQALTPYTRKVKIAWRLCGGKICGLVIHSSSALPKNPCLWVYWVFFWHLFV